MGVGSRFLAARNRKRLEQKEAAFRLDISASYLSYIENGKKRPTIDLIERAAKVYNVDPGYFFRDEDYDIGDVMNANNQGFLQDLGDLTVEEIQRKYQLTLDGQAINEDELASAIAFLRVLRQSR